uniref:Phosphatidylcholine transfer protein n=1 Tax=Sinocyclocheilus anshuiensis TaxID=1608454 RepID=A0A671RS48_9TELE
MALLFSDEEFQQAWSELDEPQLDGGWELYSKGTCLYEYKVFGSLASCAPDLCADVYMDLNYRKQWDSYVKELNEKDYGGQKAIYWEVKYPLPLSNRDYVYVRERRDLDVGGREIWVVLAKSWSVPQYYKQSLAMESDCSGSTKVFMNYFDNPGGMIPTWLVNWAAKTGVPAFLTDMKKACSNYSSYCKNNK